jgi:hypothetical protein
MVLLDLVSSAISSASVTLLKADRPGGRVDHVDHLGCVLVAGFVGECDRPAQLGGRGVIVTCLVGLEPVLDGLGELSLADVMGDMAADPRGQRFVVGSDRPGRAPGPGSAPLMPCWLSG